MPGAEDVSITATEASVAGSSVAATEAEEDASFAPPMVDDKGNKVVLTKEESLDISIATGKEEEDGEQDNGEYTAPMHLHALRTPAKLKGARSRSSSRSRSGSRRNSVSPGRSHTGEIIGGNVSTPPPGAIGRVGRGPSPTPACLGRASAPQERIGTAARVI